MVLLSLLCKKGVWSPVLSTYICGMKNSAMPFIRTISIAASLLIAADLGLHYLKPELHPFQWGGPIIAGMLLLYIIAHLYARQLAAREPKKFVTAFMAFSGLKLLVLALLTVMVFLLDREHMKESAVIIMVSYLVFTLIDWRYSRAFMRGDNN